MILYKSLKYLIYNLAIETIFNNFNKNLKFNQIKIDDKFSLIQFTTNNNTSKTSMFNVTITEFKRNKPDHYSGYYINYEKLLIEEKNKTNSYSFNNNKFIPLFILNLAIIIK